MQTRIIALVVAAVVLIGGGLFVINSRNQNSNQPSNSPTPSISPSSGEQSITDIFSAGGNKKCTFSGDTETGSTQGIFYVSGTKVRGELKSEGKDEKVQTTNIVRVGDDNYLWGDAFPTGIKMTLSVEEFAKNVPSSETFDPNQKTNFKCENWTVDESLFTPPSNIKFTDMSAMMPSSSGSSMPNPNSGMCAQCNSLSGDAKTACLKSLNCQ